MLSSFLLTSICNFWRFNNISQAYVERHPFLTHIPFSSWQWQRDSGIGIRYSASCDSGKTVSGHVVSASFLLVLYILRPSFVLLCSCEPRQHVGSCPSIILHTSITPNREISHAALRFRVWHNLIPIPPFPENIGVRVSPSVCGVLRPFSWFHLHWNFVCNSSFFTSCSSVIDNPSLESDLIHTLAPV